MCNAGLIPERTQDPKRAFHLWSADGAVILVTNRTDAGGMLAGVQDVFGPRILVRQSPTTVASSTTPGHDAAASPHIDGYMSFGDYYPDLVFLLCERQAIAGGESYIVDGQRLLSAIAGDPSQRALSRFLWEVKLEQGRPAWVGSPKPVPSRRPVASRTCGGRLTVRRHEHQRVLDDAPPRPEDGQHLATWERRAEAAGRAAPRFLLQPGELLCLDNYRVFHGQAPCIGQDRVLHKLWAWSDMAFGVPSFSDLAPVLHADVPEPSR